MNDDELEVEDIIVRNLQSKRVTDDGRTALILARYNRKISKVLFENF